VGVTSPSMSVVTRRSCRDFHNVGNNLRARLGVLKIRSIYFSLN